MGDANDRSREVDVAPLGVHHFLLALARHQKEFIPEPFFRVADGKEFVDIFLFVNLGFLFCVARPVFAFVSLASFEIDFGCGMQFPTFKHRQP